METQRCAMNEHRAAQQPFAQGTWGLLPGVLLWRSQTAIHAVSIPSSAVPPLQGCSPKARAQGQLYPPPSSQRKQKVSHSARDPHHPLSPAGFSLVLCPVWEPEVMGHCREPCSHCCDAFTSSLTFCSCVSPVWKEKTIP